MDGRERCLIRYSHDFMPFTVARASGAWVETTDGRRILDFTSGQICSTLGHNHPRIVEAVERSLREAIHLNSWMISEPVLALAERLVSITPDGLDRVMLVSTGGEANEIALRMAKMSTGRFEVAGLTKSWHGLQAGVATFNLAGGHAGYGPMMPGAFALPAPYAYRCPIRHCTPEGGCDCSCLETGFEMVDQQSVGSLCAIIAEPVLSAGGIIVPPPDYFRRMRELCDERGMLLILDESQTGFGRLGAMFGFEIFGVVPDLLTVSKTLGGGIPLGAVLTNAETEAVCHEKGFMHVTSHVSDPMPAAAGLAVIDTIEEQDLVGTAKERGERLFRGLGALQERHEQIGEVRGMGLLLGVELVEERGVRAPADELGVAVGEERLRHGMSMNIVRSTGGLANCLRLAPPLSITDEEIDMAVEILDDAISAALDRRSSVPV